MSLNNDLISRSALLDERPEYLNTDHIDVEKALFAKGWNACAHEYYSVIDNAPSVDAEVVRHGRWYQKRMSVPKGKGQTYLVWACSLCHKHEKKRSDYCPNCGAKMNAEVEG